MVGKTNTYINKQYNTRQYKRLLKTQQGNFKKINFTKKLQDNASLDGVTIQESFMRTAF